jgi:hypothetical protein
LTGWVWALVRRLSGEGLPADFPGTLAADERVLAVAEIADGGHVVATSWGLWLPDGADTRRIGWHAVTKATWSGGWLAVVEAVEVDTIDDAVLLADRPMRRLRLARPGRVPESVHERVTGSIKSSHHRDLPGGGAWVVQRTVAGRDGIQLQIRADPGTDERTVKALAAQVAGQIRRVRSGE